ncbi:monovalent cation/H+ antiporter subunit D [Steroidobacter sp. S1-65]|uniref:Monovalent cation/H+ antiporter subunit D n=1 Tax=Steroidobacter gossypii TaxID=2805490 RepID=A0ABS1X1F9_9GAMM|nr:monovalent cation/H+ antiporter subunit D [Steroidobacter gossypii]MBM0107046.1 monovalent cation/H+ antiporter subunit D [Steroidobacter gossypii]
MNWLEHLPVLPIILPLVAGSLLLFMPQSRTVLRPSIALFSTLGQVAVAAYMLYRLVVPQPGLLEHGVEVYVLGGWVAPFGIVLVVDRLSALMLALGAAIALPVHVYSLARWDRVGVHYHSMLQFLLMGLNGAFLTGDLFNLFVFFEILLAASYGLLMHGSNAVRVKAGLHYVAVNLTSSLIFLIGVALMYGAAGTLNLADLGARWAELPPADRTVFEAGVGVLGVAFLIKAGIWPLNFWLPSTYTAASPPAAAMFAILTKVGVYAMLRLGSLLSQPEAPAPFSGPWLFYGTVATMWFGIVGMLAARQLSRLVAFYVIVSSGTLLSVFALGITSAVAPALLYLIASVPAGTAFFLIAGMTERLRVNGGVETMAPQPTTYSAFMAGDPQEAELAENELEEVGVAIPAALAFLGMAFVICVILTTGLPPLVGFLAKFSLVSVLLGPAMDESSLDAWLLIVSLLATGFAGLVALTSRGIRSFWFSGRITPRLRIIEAAPVAFLVLLCVTMTVVAGPIMEYLDLAADWLHQPDAYIRAVIPAEEASL